VKKWTVGFDKIYDIDRAGRFKLNLKRLSGSKAARDKLRELAEKVNKVKVVIN